MTMDPSHLPPGPAGILQHNSDALPNLRPATPEEIEAQRAGMSKYTPGERQCVAVATANPVDALSAEEATGRAAGDVYSQLDREVAEKVMGWQHPRGELRDIGSRVMILRTTGPREVVEVGPWSPSTDIAAAWDVVERMLEIHRGNVCKISETLSATYGRVWIVAFRLKHEFADPSPCIAICRAALAAVGGGG